MATKVQSILFHGYRPDIQCRLNIRTSSAQARFRLAEHGSKRDEGNQCIMAVRNNTTCLFEAYQSSLCFDSLLALNSESRRTYWNFRSIRIFIF